MKLKQRQAAGRRVRRAQWSWMLRLEKDQQRKNSPNRLYRSRYQGSVEYVRPLGQRRSGNDKGSWCPRPPPNCHRPGRLNCRLRYGLIKNTDEAANAAIEAVKSARESLSKPLRVGNVDAILKARVEYFDQLRSLDAYKQSKLIKDLYESESVREGWDEPDVPLSDLQSLSSAQRARV